MHRAAKHIVTLFLVAFAAFATVSCNRTGSGAPGNADPSIAATVNGKGIALSEVDQLISQQTQGQQAQMSQLQLAQARLQVLDSLIQKEVLFQRADKEKLLPTEDEITQFINNQMQQANMTQEQFQKRLKEQNQTMESLREEARKQIAISKLQDKTNGKVGLPSDKEVEDFYNANKQQFVSQRGVALAEISVDPTPSEGMQDDAKSDAEAKQKIDLIYQQLKSGADFATVARARSEDSYGPRGGDIGFATEDDLKRNGFPEELVSQFFNKLEVGSYTEPVQLRNAWYIFKLQGKQLQNENKTLDSPEVRSQITEALINQRKQILNTALLEVSMNEAQIVNNLATKMLTNPDNFGLPRPAQPANSAQPSGSPGGQASPQPSGSPQTGTTTAPSPGAQASPSPKS
ncbi:MAG TPA: SurA N-terminal domain-containing protein [Pyrinomonadaceae bacterium]